MSATTVFSHASFNVPSTVAAAGLPKTTETVSFVSIDSHRNDSAAIDPEREFMAAMTAYKAQSGRMFPTWSEVLEVLRDLGYRKPAGAASPAASPELAGRIHSRVALAS